MKRLFMSKKKKNDTKKILLISLIFFIVGAVFSFFLYGFLTDYLLSRVEDVSKGSAEAARQEAILTYLGKTAGYLDEETGFKLIYPDTYQLFEIECTDCIGERVFEVNLQNPENSLDTPNKVYFNLYLGAYKIDATESLDSQLFARTCGLLIDELDYVSDECQEYLFEEFEVYSNEFITGTIGDFDYLGDKRHVLIFVNDGVVYDFNLYGEINDETDEPNLPSLRARETLKTMADNLVFLELEAQSAQN